MQLNARRVLRKDRGLKRPDTILLRLINQSFKQRAADSLPARVFTDVHGHFRNTTIRMSLRYLAQRRPTENGLTVSHHETPELERYFVPHFPRRSGRFQ